MTEAPRVARYALPTAAAPGSCPASECLLLGSTSGSRGLGCPYLSWWSSRLSTCLDPLLFRHPRNRITQTGPLFTSQLELICAERRSGACDFYSFVLCRQWLQLTGTSGSDKFYLSWKSPNCSFDSIFYSLWQWCHPQSSTSVSDWFYRHLFNPGICRVDRLLWGPNYSN